MSTTDAMTSAEREDRVLERIDKFRQRRPRLLDDVVTLAHGAGGKSSAALVDAVFLEAFRNDELEQLGDAAALRTPSGDRLAFSTDSFVVAPRRFPGGSIGHVAVHGTINDLAVSGARPQWLSAAFVIEEGFPIAELREIVADMSEAAAKAGVQIVTGDTKVVGKGAADGVYISTAGVGVIPEGRRLSRDLVQPGDKVLVSGTIGEHGMAVMLARGDLAIDADIASDTAPVHELVETSPRGGAVDAVDARRHPRRRRNGVQRTRQGLPVRARPRRGEPSGGAAGARRLRHARHRSALRRQRGQVRRGRCRRGGRCGRRRDADASARCQGDGGRRDHARTERHCCAPDFVRRQPNRRHARRRPTTTNLLMEHEKGV